MEQLKRGKAQGVGCKEKRHKAELVRERKVHEMENCEHNQWLMLELRSGNKERVRFKGHTGDAVIVESYKLPYWLIIRREEIKSYKVLSESDLQD